MTRKLAQTSLVLVAALSFTLVACKDTKTLQENEKLKSQVAQLQKDNGQLGNNLETVTAARDELAKENDALKAELKTKKTKHAVKKVANKKRRRA